MPYTNTELDELARHCTDIEDIVKKIVRRVEKSAAALLLQTRIGEQFDAIITGASDKGTWVRLQHPPIEGKLVSGFSGMDVGHRLRVKLLHADVQRGFIDFTNISSV
jgi:exoribonuclease-2